MSQRTRVINLYKTLVYLGRDYPLGWDYFRPRLKAAFLKNKDIKDPEVIDQLLARGHYVIKEIEALYMLRKYRTLKNRYYADEKDVHISEITKSPCMLFEEIMRHKAQVRT